MDDLSFNEMLNQAAGATLTVMSHIQAMSHKRAIDRLSQFAKDAECRLSKLDQKVTDEEIARTFSRLAWAAARDTSTEKTKICATILAGRYSATLEDAIADTLISIIDE